jgi:GNAT superfamily N-acetyltransferase
MEYTELVRHIETLAMNAWPAETIEPLDGWKLRQDAAPSRRVNSVWPNEWGGKIPVAKKLDDVEAFYAGYQQPARYQICPANLPEGLDTVLEARGYWVDAPTMVQTTDIETGLQKSTPKIEYDVALSESLTPEYLDTYGTAGTYPKEKLKDTEDALRRVTRRAIYGIIYLDGQGVAVGRGVLDSGWMGVFGMATREEHRRKGLATAILHAMLKWGKANGVKNLYLQVEESNPGAQGVYQRLGFESSKQ